MACMLVLDIDYRPQCVAHALQVREFHSMLGRGARTSTFRVRVITHVPNQGEFLSSTHDRDRTRIRLVYTL